MPEIVLSLQLYSMRKLGSLDAQLSAVANAGFRFVEPLEGHLGDAIGLEQGLARHGLVSPTAHMSLTALRAEPSRIIDACLRCGIGQLFVQDLGLESAHETADAWRRRGAELGTLALRFQQDGISLGYHNMEAGFTYFQSGHSGFEVLFAAARGTPLTWQADIAWLGRAGVDPAEWLRRHANVLVSAHVKDQAPEGLNEDEGGWCDVGAGTLVWPALWRAAVIHGARTLVVEHDNPTDPLEFARRSFAYLSRFSDHSRLLDTRQTEKRW